MIYKICCRTGDKCSLSTLSTTVSFYSWLHHYCLLIWKLILPLWIILFQVFFNRITSYFDDRVQYTEQLRTTILLHSQRKIAQGSAKESGWTLKKDNIKCRPIPNSINICFATIMSDKWVSWRDFLMKIRWRATSQMISRFIFKRRIAFQHFCR